MLIVMLVILYHRRLDRHRLKLLVDLVQLLCCHQFQMLSCVYLQGEVHMTRGVNDVDQVLVPGAGGSSRSDGDASLLLLSHPVHSGSALMHLPDLVCLASVV